MNLLINNKMIVIDKLYTEVIDLYCSYRYV